MPNVLFFILQDIKTEVVENTDGLAVVKKEDVDYPVETPEVLGSVLSSNSPSDPYEPSKHHEGDAITDNAESAISGKPILVPLPPKLINNNSIVFNKERYAGNSSLFNKENEDKDLDEKLLERLRGVTDKTVEKKKKKKKDKKKKKEKKKKRKKRARRASESDVSRSQSSSPSRGRSSTRSRSRSRERRCVPSHDSRSRSRGRSFNDKHRGSNRRDFSNSKATTSRPNIPLSQRLGKRNDINDSYGIPNHQFRNTKKQFTKPNFCKGNLTNVTVKTSHNINNGNKNNTSNTPEHASEKGSITADTPHKNPPVTSAEPSSSLIGTTSAEKNSPVCGTKRQLEPQKKPLFIPKRARAVDFMDFMD